MDSKYEIIGDLTSDLLIETARRLSNQGVVSVASTSTQHLQLFKPLVELRKLSQFLHHVTHDNHDAVVAMLLAGDMSLFYKKGQVTDCSGRIFENVSGFEYALWALDKHMWTRILECIPKTEESHGVLKLMQGQYDNLSKKGITYTLNGQTITEQHFDFQNTIIKELQTQIGLINATGVLNWDVIDKQWIEGVGRAQRDLPMHVVVEYCSNEPFFPVPQFTSQPKSATRFNNLITFSLDSKLGVDFAIYKTERRGWGWGGGLASRGMEGSDYDLVAVTALCEVRTSDFIALKSELEVLVFSSLVNSSSAPPNDDVSFKSDDKFQSPGICTIF